MKLVRAASGDDIHLWTKGVAGFCGIPVVGEVDFLNAVDTGTGDVGLFTGTVSGTTVDNSGAMIPKATVTVENVGTGHSQTLKTNGSGSFSASDLPFGTYSVTATASGFGTATTKNVVLNVGATVHVTMKLSAAAVSETVTVTGT